MRYKDKEEYSTDHSTRKILTEKLLKDARKRTIFSETTTILSAAT